MATPGALLASLADVDIDQVIGWAVLNRRMPMHNRLFHIERAITGIPSCAWTQVTENRRNEMYGQETYHHFEVSGMRGGFSPYVCNSVVQLSDGRTAAIFDHVADIRPNVVVMRHSSSSLVLRLEVQGSNNHISIRAEYLSGCVAYANTVPLTRKLKVRDLKNMMSTYLRDAGSLGPFQSLHIIKIGTNRELHASTLVWNPTWRYQAIRVRRRLFVKTSLIQLKLDRFFKVVRSSLR